MKIQGFRITQQTVKLGNLTSEYESIRFKKYCPPAGWRPNIDVYRFADRYHVIAELAGVDDSQISLSVEGQVLVLRGERGAPKLDQKKCPCEQALSIEIECGPFHRELRFPDPIDSDAITARYSKGLLLIDVPRKNG